MEDRQKEIEDFLKDTGSPPDSEDKWLDDQKRIEAQSSARMSTARARNLENLVAQRENFAKRFVWVAIC